MLKPISHPGVQDNFLTKRGKEISKNNKTCNDKHFWESLWLVHSTPKRWTSEGKEDISQVGWTLSDKIVNKNMNFGLRNKLN
jgi:hypothetical protein